MPTGVYERLSAEERFWSKVNKDNKSGCWNWTSSLDKNGYGKLKINGKTIRAHRFSYELHKDLIPEGMVIMHTCDNPKCVNFDHLLIGTHADNIRDKVNKNRQVKGSLVKSAKLTEEQVKQIKQKLNLGIRQIDIAQEHGIKQTQISNIKAGKSWAHIN